MKIEWLDTLSRKENAPRWVKALARWINDFLDSPTGIGIAVGAILLFALVASLEWGKKAACLLVPTLPICAPPKPLPPEPVPAPPAPVASTPASVAQPASTPASAPRAIAKPPQTLASMLSKCKDDDDACKNEAIRTTTKYWDRARLDAKGYSRTEELVADAEGVNALSTPTAGALTCSPRASGVLHRLEHLATKVSVNAGGGAKVRVGDLDCSASLSEIGQPLMTVLPRACSIGDGHNLNFVAHHELTCKTGDCWACVPAGTHTTGAPAKSLNSIAFFAGAKSAVGLLETSRALSRLTVGSDWPICHSKLMRGDNAEVSGYCPGIDDFAH